MLVNNFGRYVGICESCVRGWKRGPAFRCRGLRSRWLELGLLDWE